MVLLIEREREREFQVSKKWYTVSKPDGIEPETTKDWG